MKATLALLDPVHNKVIERGRRKNSNNIKFKARRIKRERAPRTHSHTHRKRGEIGERLRSRSLLTRRLNQRRPSMPVPAEFSVIKEALPTSPVPS